jgi:hypothetical protein
MFHVYRNENEEFLKHLFERPDQQLRYMGLVQALKDAFPAEPSELGSKPVFDKM